MKSLYCKCGDLRSSEKSKRCLKCQKESVYKSRSNSILEGRDKEDVYGYRNRKKNLEKYLISVAKSSAKKRGLDFNIDISDLIIPEICPVLGIQISNSRENRNPNAPSIDRIDSAKGYLKGNVQIISWRANYLKGNGTLEEFTKLVEFLNAEKRTI